jgi:hypothetical protein
MTNNNLKFTLGTLIENRPYKHLAEYERDVMSERYSHDSDEGKAFRALVNDRLAKSQPYIMPGIYASAKRNLWLTKDGLQ